MTPGSQLGESELRDLRASVSVRLGPGFPGFYLSQVARG